MGTLCNIYHKFIKKISDGFECKLCSKQIKQGRNGRSLLYDHIKEKHPESLNSSDLENKLEEKCEKCHEMINIYAKVQHSRSCDLYYKFMKKTLDGYECLLCSKRTILRFNMYHHIKVKHQKN